MGAYGDIPSNGLWGAACHLERNADVNVPDSTWTAIPWHIVRDFEDWRPSANTERLKPTRFTGSLTFLVTANVRVAAHATGRRNVQILKNGATVVAESNIPSPSGTAAALLSVATLVPLTVGDYLTVEVWQNSGATLAVQAGSTASLVWAWY